MNNERKMKNNDPESIINNYDFKILDSIKLDGGYIFNDFEGMIKTLELIDAITWLNNKNNDPL